MTGQLLATDYLSATSIQRTSAPLFKGVDDEGSFCCVSPCASQRGSVTITLSTPFHCILVTSRVNPRILAIIHRQCIWTTALQDTFVYTAHRKQTSAGFIRRSVHIIESKVHSVCTLSTSASQTSVFHIFVVHNSVEAWLPSRGGRDLAFPAKQPHIGTAYGQKERPSPCAKRRYRPVAHRNHPLCAQNRHLGAAVWRRCG